MMRSPRPFSALGEAKAKVGSATTRLQAPSNTFGEQRCPRPLLPRTCTWVPEIPKKGLPALLLLAQEGRRQGRNKVLQNKCCPERKVCCFHEDAAVDEIWKE